MVRVLKRSLLILALLISFGQAEEQPDPVETEVLQIDTSFMSDSLKSDIVKIDLPDSLLLHDKESLGSTDDSIIFVFPKINPDTLSDNQRLGIEREMRFELRREKIIIKEAPEQFSFVDSMISWVLPKRWNQREDIGHSFYYDAGDYFRFNQNFSIVSHQITPMRKTVQPYALGGDRLSLISNNQHIVPFEHIIEPDGLTDLNDFPTALDHDVYILPGAVGQLFDSRQSVATLLTKPEKRDSHRSKTTFLVDKGGLGFSNARAGYSRDFISGRKINLTLGYRKANGPELFREDNTYQYSAETYFPVNSKYGIKASGWLYDRQGSFVVRRFVNSATFGSVDGNTAHIKRERIDRKAAISLVKHAENLDGNAEIGLTYLKQVSNLDNNYKGRFGQSGRGLFALREWIAGATIVKTQFNTEYKKYEDGFSRFFRWSGDLSIVVARTTDKFNYALSMRQALAEQYGVLPAITFLLSSHVGKTELLLSGGYSVRAPTLYELNLRYQEAPVYLSTVDYADSGNPDLKKEKQLVGTAEIKYGGLKSNLQISVTGGRIYDGIDWVNSKQDSLTVFSPENGELQFASPSMSLKLGITDFLRFKSGGSYHYTDYENFASRPYSPEYQFFSGMEMHFFWSQKLIDLYAYGEIHYTGPYHGYVQQNLGEEAVINIKLSFKMGSFKFHWISQNSVNNPYYSRESFLNLGRYNSYGFTWDFLD